MKNAEFFSPCRKAKLSFGFTLAEVLITLGIIGIVAAITIPSLVQKYKVMVLRNQFKTAESVLQQAFQKSITELGYTNVNEFTIPGGKVTTANFEQLKLDTAQLNGIWLKNLKVIKKFEVRDFSRAGYGCYPVWGDNKLNQHNCQFSLIGGYLLSNGILVTSLTAQYGGINHPGQIMFTFDTNGLKGPNRHGHDIFIYTSSKGYYSMCGSTRSINYTSLGCYNFAIKNTNPVYKDREYWDILFKPKSYFEKK